MKNQSYKTKLSVSRGTYGILIFISLFLICSCERNSINELLGEEEIEDAPVIATFDNTAAPIFNNFCVECHNINDPTAGVRLDDFKFAVMDAEVALARMNNVNNPMPPSGQLPQPIIDEIMRWIEDGLLEN